jgi:hypothetical protein
MADRRQPDVSDMEPSEIRKQVVHAIDQARRRAAAQREDAERLSRSFAQLLPHATAGWKVVASVLKAEGHPFKVNTPAGALRLASDRSPDDFIEIGLDTSRRPVAVVGRTGLTRGRRVIDREVVIAEGDAVTTLDEQTLLTFLLEELGPFVER